MTTLVHALLALAAWAYLWRVVTGPGLLAHAPSADVASAFALTVLIASAAGSVGAIVAGRAVGALRMLALDASAFGGALLALVVLGLGFVWPRELGGVFAVLVVALRLAPAAWAIATGAAAPWIALGVAFGAYGALAAWLPVASLPFGDQVHYLIAADRLAQGRLDLAIDPAAFERLLGFAPGPEDIATHVANTPLGPRPVQGYALPLLILPGWVIAGRLGAGLVMAFFGAWASYQMLLILRDVGGALPLVRSPRQLGWTWLIASASAPLALLATHVYPNVVGAAFVATAYRLAFTAPVRRPALAAALLALMLFLNPRDAIPLAVLLPLLWLREAAARRRIALTTALVVLAAVALGALLYGVPLPYPGYLIGTGQTQAATRESSFTPFIWVSLPGMLFDRTFGLAGSAPWVFVGLAGLVPALRADRARLAPAALTVGASLLALSFFRLWEGGYAPPARYFVDVLPLWAPFVAYGVAAARDAARRALVAVLVGMSALTSLVLSAAPALALNGAYDDKIRDTLASVLGIDPLGWLPSFVPVTPDWWIGAYLALIPALAACALLLGPPLRVPFPRPGLRTFLALSAVAIAWTEAAALQPWTGDVADPIPESLLRRWLPLALGLATLGSALVARLLEGQARSRLLRRHFLLYIAALLSLLLAHFGEGVPSWQRAALYLLVPAGFALLTLTALAAVVERVGDRKAALHLGLVVLLALSALLPYHRVLAVMPTASDEPHYLIVTLSLFYEGTLDTRAEYFGDRYLEFYPERLPDVHALPMQGGLFPLRDLGLPVLGVVPYALAGRVGVQALMVLAAAALAAQLYLLLRDLRVAPRAALLAVATAAFAPPILTYATLVYPDLLTALALVTAVRLLRAGARASSRELAWASALLGALPWLSTRTWPAVLGVGLVLAWCALRPPSRARGGRALARIASAVLPFAALMLGLSYVNWRMFDLFMPSASYFLIRGVHAVLDVPWVGAPGLLFDAVYGLVPRAPVYLLAAAGAVSLWRRRREQPVELAALALGGLLSFAFISDLAYWTAYGTPPSRYLFPVLPLLVAATGAGWEVVLAVPAWARALGAAAAAWSALVAYAYAAVPGVRIDPLPEAVRDAGAGSRLFELLAPVLAFDPASLFPSLVRLDGASVALAAAWSGAVALAAFAGSRVVHRPEVPPAVAPPAPVPERTLRPSP